MKKTIVSFSAATLIIAIGTFMGCNVMEKLSETVENESAGLNGDFEVTQSGMPVNWILYTPKTVPNSDFDLVIDREEFKSGKQSLKFVVRECSATGGRLSPGFTRQVAAEPGATYRVSFWAKNHGSEFRFIVGGVSAWEGKYGVDVRSSEFIEEWQRMQYEFRVPEEFEQLQFQLNVLKPGTFWIDNLSVDKIAD